MGINKSLPEWLRERLEKDPEFRKLFEEKLEELRRCESRVKLIEKKLKKLLRGATHAKEGRKDKIH